MFIISLLIQAAIGYPLLVKRDDNSSQFLLLVGVLCVCASLLLGALLSYFCNSFTKAFTSSTLKRFERKNSKDYKQRQTLVQTLKSKQLYVIQEEPEVSAPKSVITKPPPYTEKILVSTENQRKKKNELKIITDHPRKSKPVLFGESENVDYTKPMTDNSALNDSALKNSGLNDSGLKNSASIRVQPRKKDSASKQAINKISSASTPNESLWSLQSKKVQDSQAVPFEKKSNLQILDSKEGNQTGEKLDIGRPKGRKPSISSKYGQINDAKSKMTNSPNQQRLLLCLVHSKPLGSFLSESNQISKGGNFKDSKIGKDSTGNFGSDFGNGFGNDFGQPTTATSDGSLQFSNTQQTPNGDFLNFPTISATPTVEVINVDIPTVTPNVIIINTDPTSSVVSSISTSTSVQNSTTTTATTSSTTVAQTTAPVLPLLPSATPTAASSTQSGFLQSTNQFFNQNKMIVIIVGSTIGVLLLVLMGVYLKPKRKQPPLMDLNKPDSIPELSNLGDSQVFGGQKDIIVGKPADNPFKGQTPISAPVQFDYRPPRPAQQRAQRFNQPIPPKHNQPIPPKYNQPIPQKYNQIPQKPLLKQPSYSLDPRDSMYTDDDAAVSLAMHALSERLESDDTSSVSGFSRRPSLVSNFRTTFLSSVNNGK
ncbi:hypothetical protein HDV06_006572 [Boothiomyces sp. JEL0866]|nr:hypothetical protein HDV06_006572 [Boothiomyces sp. JEL0866]